MQETEPQPTTPDRTKGGVKSVDICLKVLKALVAHQGPINLSDLASTTHLHPAKLHRYLASLSQSGFVSRIGPGRYDLGSYALEFATSSFARLDPTQVAASMLESLWSETNEGIILSVWGDSGTTVIRWLQSRRPISVGIRPGSVFSSLMSASGQIFLAHMSESMAYPIMQAELKQLHANNNSLAPKNLDDAINMIKSVRENGLACVEGHSISFVSALAAPIFDYRGQVVLCLALFGFKNEFDVSPEGRNAKLVKQAAYKISKNLGYVDKETSPPKQ